VTESGTFDARELLKRTAGRPQDLGDVELLESLDDFLEKYSYLGGARAAFHKAGPWGRHIRPRPRCPGSAVDGRYGRLGGGGAVGRSGRVRR
jgi:hypothetical protein